MSGHIVIESAEEWCKARFPLLTDDNFAVTSPKANTYNCIAWTAGDDTRWWSPNYDYHWPQRPIPPGALALREATLTSLFAYLGYEVCADGAYEAHYDKVVLYSKVGLNGQKQITHAAKQLDANWWSSKLGKGYDIRHRRPEDVNSPGYGSPYMYMRRRKPA
jgi:hypothetical protein